MFNGIPLGAACGIVRDGHGQAITIREVLLQLLFPHARTTTITASAVSQNQDLLGLGIGHLPLILPPTGKSSNRKCGRVSRRADVHRPTIAKHIIDAVRNCFSYGILRKVMGIDRFWSLFPCSSSVLKIPDQFLLLGIHTDDRAVDGLKLFLSAPGYAQIACFGL